MLVVNSTVWPPDKKKEGNIRIINVDGLSQTFRSKLEPKLIFKRF